ncbi:uncharacterized protein LOC130963034 [Arachis stenosperma]|uniref:uncharacterized protein LOC130963034 n=1 Tax=Arachis stenosperma TaxID=217475 RepID=UPI0025AB5D8F|nr:uncharacterized protein LOC130963034 [Arachis stenosperma]
MRGGFVRRGHSRSHEPRKFGKKMIKCNRMLKKSEQEMTDTQGQCFKNVEKDTPEIRVERADGICNVVINEVVLKQLRHPWWDTLIVKLLSRRISLAVLTRRLEAMWGKQGSIEVIDLGNDFFIVKFYSQEDLDFALIGGPWRIFDHYLTISFWKTNFNPMEASIEYTVAWVRLPGLMIEYYEKSMLERIGNIIGRTIKVDSNTADICRGKFARLCVELDLPAPWFHIIPLMGVKYVVEYEGIHNICFSCGMVGHEKTNYPKKVQTQKAPESNNSGTEKN